MHFYQDSSLREAILKCIYLKTELISDVKMDALCKYACDFLKMCLI